MDRTQDTEMESFGSDEIISHYFASRIKANEEIRELLAALSHAVVAEAAHFFEPHGDALALRCTTDDEGKVILTNRGILPLCLRERKPFFSGEVKREICGGRLYQGYQGCQDNIAHCHAGHAGLDAGRAADR